MNRIALDVSLISNSIFLVYSLSLSSSFSNTLSPILYLSHSPCLLISFLLSRFHSLSSSLCSFLSFLILSHLLHFNFKLVSLCFLIPLSPSRSSSSISLTLYFSSYPYSHFLTPLLLYPSPSFSLPYFPSPPSPFLSFLSAPLHFPHSLYSTSLHFLSLFLSFLSTPLLLPHTRHLSYLPPSLTFLSFQVSVLRHHDGDEDGSYAEEVCKKGLGAFNYCLGL